MQKTISKTKVKGVIDRVSKMIIALVLGLFLCVQSTQTAFAASVIAGKDGWLFYTGDDTISDYYGTDLFTLPQLQMLALRLQAFRTQLAMRGCEFVVLIAPNKEQVYAKYMPDSYGQPAAYTRAQQVSDYLKMAGFRVVYPIEELSAAIEAHPEYNFYYTGDTHWNNLGAYVGARALLSELGIDWPAIEELNIQPYVINQGDLAGMIGRTAVDINYNLSGYSDNPILVSDLSSSSVARFMSLGGDARKVLVAGDSFANALSGYLASAFNQVVVNHDRQNYRPSLLLSEQPDIFIYEIVERYLNIMGSDNALSAY